MGAYLNDSFRIPAIIDLDASLVAVSALFLAARKSKFKLPDNPPWFEIFGASTQEIRHVAQMILEIYELPPTQYHKQRKEKIRKHVERQKLKKKMRLQKEKEKERREAERKRRKQLEKEKRSRRRRRRSVSRSRSISGGQRSVSVGSRSPDDGGQPSVGRRDSVSVSVERRSRDRHETKRNRKKDVSRSRSRSRSRH